MKPQRDFSLSCHRAAILIGGSALWAQGELTRSGKRRRPEPYLYAKIRGKKEEIMNYLKTLSDLYRLKKNAKLSAKKMKSLQDGKLRKLIRFAWEHSAYYRSAF